MSDAQNKPNTTPDEDVQLAPLTAKEAALQDMIQKFGESMTLQLLHASPERRSAMEAQIALHPTLADPPHSEEELQDTMHYIQTLQLPFTLSEGKEDELEKTLEKYQAEIEKNLPVSRETDEEKLASRIVQSAMIQLLLKKEKLTFDSVLERSREHPSKTPMPAARTADIYSHYLSVLLHRKQIEINARLTDA